MSDRSPAEANAAFQGCDASCRAVEQGWPAPCEMYPDERIRGCSRKQSIDSPLASPGERGIDDATTRTRRDWRFGHISVVSEEQRSRAETITADVNIAMRRTVACLEMNERIGSSGCWFGNESLLAIRRVVEEVTDLRAHVSRLESDRARMYGMYTVRTEGGQRDEVEFRLADRIHIVHRLSVVPALCGFMTPASAEWAGTLSGVVAVERAEMVDLGGAARSGSSTESGT